MPSVIFTSLPDGVDSQGNVIKKWKGTMTPFRPVEGGLRVGHSNTLTEEPSNDPFFQFFEPIVYNTDIVTKNVEWAKPISLTSLFSVTNGYVAYERYRLEIDVPLNNQKAKFDIIDLPEEFGEADYIMGGVLYNEPQIAISGAPDSTVTVEQINYVGQELSFKPPSGSLFVPPHTHAFWLRNAEISGGPESLFDCYIGGSISFRRFRKNKTFQYFRPAGQTSQSMMLPVATEVDVNLSKYVGTSPGTITMKVYAVMTPFDGSPTKKVLFATIPPTIIDNGFGAKYAVWDLYNYPVSIPQDLECFGYRFYHEILDNSTVIYTSSSSYSPVYIGGTSIGADRVRIRPKNWAINSNLLNDAPAYFYRLNANI